MPKRLRPTAATAPRAVLVGDPGRALLLAQELLAQPKMSNHARGLWGYYGETPAGTALTVQSTGMGGPSAALVIADLAELGVEHAVRVGTCAAHGGAWKPGELAIVTAARTGGGLELAPDAAMTADLEAHLAGQARLAPALSVDQDPAAAEPAQGIELVDMQTAPLLERAGQLGISFAALLIVAELAGRAPLARDELEEAERRAGHAAAAVL